MMARKIKSKCHEACGHHYLLNNVYDRAAEEFLEAVHLQPEPDPKLLYQYHVAAGIKLESSDHGTKLIDFDMPRINPNHQ